MILGERELCVASPSSRLRAAPCAGSTADSAPQRFRKSCITARFRRIGRGSRTTPQSATPGSTLVNDPDPIDVLNSVGRDDAESSAVPLLVVAAQAGDRSAWDDLVVRYTPLVLSITARYRLQAPDAADVTQTVWLRLCQHLGELREPRALPGWLVSTTRNECLRLLSAQRRVVTYDPLLPHHDASLVEPDPAEASADVLLRADRHAALLAAIAELSDGDRNLLLMFLHDPPLRYAEISRQLGVPIGSLGPQRARALDRLRRNPVLTALRDNDDERQQAKGRTP
jgi:RNA polymerase sigma factor (sigma-70 family)